MSCSLIRTFTKLRLKKTQRIAPSVILTNRWALSIALSLVAVIALSACRPNLGSSIQGWSPAVAGDGVVYVATQQGKVKALVDDGTGVVSVKWIFPAGENDLGGAYNTPLVGEKLIYVAAVDGTLYAIDKETGTIGQKGWTASLVQDSENQHLVSGPVIDANQRTILVGSDDNHLYAIDAETGVEKWKFMAGDKIWTTPVIANNLVYFGSHDRTVYALELRSGNVKWQFSTGGAIVARPLVWRDMVLIGSFDRRLYALDAKTGTEVWTFDGSDNWFWAGATASNNLVFAPSMDGHVYALDRVGNLQWDYDAGSPLVADPVIVPRGLVVASRGGDVSLIDINAGTLINEYSDINPTKILSPLFTLPIPEDELSLTGIQASGDNQQESVFIGAQDGTVYRIQAKSGLIKVWCFDTEEESACK